MFSVSQAGNFLIEEGDGSRSSRSVPVVPFLPLLCNNNRYKKKELTDAIRNTPASVIDEDAGPARNDE